MNRANVFSRAVMLSLLPAMVFSVDPNMQKNLNLAYGNQGGPAITKYSMTQMLDYINQIKPSAIANFMLNVQPSRLQLYQPLLNNLIKAGYPIYPALGQPQDTSKEIDDPYYKNIADGYRTFTDSIQIDGPQMYSEAPFHVANLYNMVDYLSGKGFKHIQMNTWPIEPGNNAAYRFNNTAVDSAIEQVEVDFTNPPQNTRYNASNPENWKINAKKITEILKARPTARIIINYENKPQEALLGTFTTQRQLDIFQITINSIADTPGLNGQVRWTPPWSVNYDPIANGTFNFYVRTFANGNPP